MVYDFIAVDGCIDGRELAQGITTGFHEERHQAQFDVMPLDELIFVFAPQIHNGFKVDFVE